MVRRDETMGHPEDGQIQAYLDGEAAEEGAGGLRRHLAECSSCNARADALRAAGDRVVEALTLLDHGPDMARARERFRTRREESSDEVTPIRKGRKGPSWSSRLTLPRAASIALLLTGAAVTALPGSPVRRWVVGGWEALTGSQITEAPVSQVASQPEPEAVPPDPEPDPTPAEVGATLPSGEEGVELWIQDLPQGAQVRIVWIEGGQAGIYAGAGTRYRRETNRLEADAPPGSVRVEIPRTLTRAVVGVNGAVILRLTEEGMELSRPVESSSDTEILFSPFGVSNP